MEWLDNLGENEAATAGEPNAPTSDMAPSWDSLPDVEWLDEPRRSSATATRGSLGLQLPGLGHNQHFCTSCSWRWRRYQCLPFGEGGFHMPCAVVVVVVVVLSTGSHNLWRAPG